MTRVTIQTRFAPSPTGRLHLGHALAARVAHDMARQSPGGRFLLRFEDIDGPRVREEYYDEIERNLEWLRLRRDGEAVRQSHRTAAYQSALVRLRDLGVAYPCFCTRKEIQDEWSAMAAAPQGPDGPVYPGTCRRLTPEQRAEKFAANIPHAWRLDAEAAFLTTGRLSFNDLRFGTIPVQPDRLGDVVLARKDIGPAYHLAVVVDDAWQEITHVTRGEDLLSSTHVHRLLQVLLDLPEPVYLHHRLVVDATGKRLAKRCDSLSIDAMRRSGMTPDEVLTMAGR
jgi:glutamyl-Q tRNA(Asp) synthetase